MLLLDDVLSELDSNRQQFLLNSIGQIQTVITCTGLDEFVNSQFAVHKTFQIQNGTVIHEITFSFLKNIEGGMHSVRE